MKSSDVMQWLERHGSPRTVEGMARYGITSARAYGVPVGAMLRLAKEIGKDQALSLDLWKRDWYETRMVAAMVGESALVTRSQMNAWAADFDSWGICDTVCFHLFDRAPFAWEKAHQWAMSPREFVKRAAFSIMAGLVLHDKEAPDSAFLELFPLIEQGAEDERNFVKKGVNWALRTIGKRNLALNAAAIATARRLAARDEAPCRWVGKDALRELTSPAVQARLAKRAKAVARNGVKRAAR